MKNIFLILGILSLSTSVFAATCEGDVHEMDLQIQQYKSITSPDGHRFHQVKSPRKSNNVCLAEGYAMYSGKDDMHLVCTIAWQLGNWGDTFKCVA